MTSRSPALAVQGDGSVTIRKVASLEAAGDDAVKVTLFRARDDAACGWYIGPASVESGQLTIPYLPKSAKTLASVAVVRAVHAAEKAGSTVCLVDPENLWTLAWRS